jgi:predicted homoserine dehydrogenase-like protein
MVTSFADGSKISFRNGRGRQCDWSAGRPNGACMGQRCSHVNEAANLFPMDKLLNGGLVDYVLGAEPPGGVFVLGFNDDPIEQQYLNYYKMGSGPLYVFYTPYHLCHFEVPISIARAALFEDAIVKPLGGTVCDVITVAKCDLRAGDVLDGIGGFTCYGMLDNTSVCNDGNLLPMGLSEGCRLKCDIPKDRAIQYLDVDLPSGRLANTLRSEQNDYFFSKS